MVLADGLEVKAVRWTLTGATSRDAGRSCRLARSRTDTDLMESIKYGENKTWSLVLLVLTLTPIGLVDSTILSLIASKISKGSYSDSIV